MVVKALDEEIPDRSKEAQKKFIQYKKDNPSKLMLLHFNGNARDPNFDLCAFKHEDWTYFVGTHSAKFISKTDTQIFVENSDVFRKSDDIAIVPVADDGELIWQYAEQAKLLQVNKNNSITVQRRVFNSHQRSYKKGKAYLAPHVSQPALAPGSKQALWRYNFSNIANLEGMPERLAKNLLSYIGEGGTLSLFDGVEFDVLADIRGLKHPSRKTPIDYNHDGVASQLDKDYQQQYRYGVYRFLTYLRKALGPEKLILADGNESNQQRAFGILNGIESETWPSHWDHEIEQWSSGINRHLFWFLRGFSPSFNYIKMGKIPSKHGPAQSPPDNLRRLRIAGALFTNTIIAPAYRPRGMGIDNWPELTTNTEGYHNWLGKPLTEIHFLKLGQHKSVEFKLDSQRSNLKNTDDSVMLSAINNNKVKAVLNFELEMPGDITITAKVRSKSAIQQEGQTRRNYIAISPKGDEKQKNMTWSDNMPFEGRFYFKELKKGQNILTLTSDADFIELADLMIEYGTSIPYRVFEHGIVIANPSRESVKLNGSMFADHEIAFVNLKNKNIMIQAKDAMFLKL